MKWLILMHYCQLTLHGQVMASLISLETLREALANFGYPAVILFVMIECLGIPFPGETMLLLASFYAAVDHRLQIPIVIVSGNPIETGLVSSSVARAETSPAYP